MPCMVQAPAVARYVRSVQRLRRISVAALPILCFSSGEYRFPGLASGAPAPRGAFGFRRCP
jgi:hypothetical protein